MILIADSGSTKTDWLLVNGKNNTFISTAGINPYYMSSEKISDVLEKELLPLIPAKEVISIYFYGSGCSTENKRTKIITIFNKLFPNTSVEVDHDMLAAARALCDSKEGIACILGTGSNACVFNGQKITRQMVSLGYFFGDEGSGTHLGKLLITHYLQGSLPTNIAEALYIDYNLTLEMVLDSIYNKPWPNRFLASFAPFILKYSKDTFIKSMVESSFDQFFEMGVMKFTGYKKMNVNFVGSIAFHFQEILLKVAKNKGVKVNKIQKSVIEGLKDYHKS